MNIDQQTEQDIAAHNELAAKRKHASKKAKEYGITCAALREKMENNNGRTVFRKDILPRLLLTKGESMKLLADLREAKEEIADLKEEKAAKAEANRIAARKGMANLRERQKDEQKQEPVNLTLLKGRKLLYAQATELAGDARVLCLDIEAIVRPQTNPRGETLRGFVVWGQMEFGPFKEKKEAVAWANKLKEITTLPTCQ